MAVSLRYAQQSVLWSNALIACFVGTIEQQRLRIRWNEPLRKLYGLATNQKLRGGPILNSRVAKLDLHGLQQACDALVAESIPINATFHATINGSLKQLRVVAERVDASNRLAGFLQELESATTSDQLSHISSSRWQSVGRLTLVDEVASAMAHELNQPLAAITTFSQAGERLLSLPEPRLEKARQVFAEVAQQALRAGDLIRRMRGLIKRNPPTNASIRIAELISGFMSLAEPLARTHHVEVSTPTELPVTMVLVDVTQIHQVMLILFQNALDAVLSSEVNRKVISVEVQQSANKITMAVVDGGKGIAPTIAAQLFQPFFSTKEGGTGLGLISARNILESYGSHLEYANQPQGGCKFWFALPVSNE